MNSYLTTSELDAMIQFGLSQDTPFGIAGVSRTQLSIARHYGGCKFQGQNYTYFHDTDELIRDDVLQFVTKHRKALAKHDKREVALNKKVKQETLI